MRLHALTALALLATALVGCSGGDSNSDNDDNATLDAAVEAPDAMPPEPDAAPETVGFGQSCTPDQMNPQGDCPDGFVCIGVQGGTGAFCTQTCDTPQAPCEADYDGPGLLACLLSSGGTPQMPEPPHFCMIICDIDMCPEGACDGTCPGDLTCGEPQGMANQRSCL